MKQMLKVKSTQIEDTLNGAKKLVDKMLGKYFLLMK